MVALPGHHKESVERVENLAGGALLVGKPLVFRMHDAALNAALVTFLEYLPDRRREIECMKPERLADVDAAVRMKVPGQGSEFDVSPVRAAPLCPHPLVEFRNLSGIIQERFGVISEWEGDQPASRDPAIDLAKDNSVN